MPRFSANLGFLWRELSLPEAIGAAAQAGFDAVECHWPYGHDPLAVKAALDAGRLTMLGINTMPGREGEFGLSALPGREAEARAAIDEAIGYAVMIGAKRIHVMAGLAAGGKARRVFLANLDHACCVAEEHDIGILVEPINSHDVPGYFLDGFDLAAELISRAGRRNLKLMFDFYHAGRMGHDVLRLFENLMPVTGHVQIAAVPDRGPPDHGEIDYAEVFDFLDAIGWSEPVGAEYRPVGKTEESLAWLGRRI
ncbi:MAG: TIM barrel protein [Nitratireductor sp.]|nr:TIM barrel protein [Nitratireductor sp.]